MWLRDSGVKYFEFWVGGWIAPRQEMVKKAVGFIGEIRWDKSKPDGTPRKLLDVAKIRGLGLKPKISVEGGIAATYDWFLKNAPEAKA